MRRHIEMEDAAGANFHNDEHIDQAESCRHNNEEIAWLRTKVIQLWVDCFRLGSLGMYRRTVRGEI